MFGLELSAIINFIINLVILTVVVILNKGAFRRIHEILSILSNGECRWCPYFDSEQYHRMRAESKRKGGESYDERTNTGTW